MPSSAKKLLRFLFLSQRNRREPVYSGYLRVLCTRDPSRVRAGLSTVKNGLVRKKNGAECQAQKTVQESAPHIRGQIA